MSDKKQQQPIDPALVRELAAIINESGLSEIEVEHGELRLRIARTLTAAPVSHVVHAAPAAVAAVAAPPPAAAPAPVADAGSHPGAVPSPMVGTAYLSPEPGAAQFIKVGDSVSEGQTLMVVEAMKTFNPIPAPRAGKIIAILVTDAQPVEYGEPLVIIE
ncbi:MAG: acetyl-CoA carboxylase biotin carboxyl carrier protein [Hyphomonadaceae bacterium]|jgi:acetyl-CoA carboxylase biotin carboxyl carrier protein|nr:acetyl-CoA carboxylase biotin carboxyl carrier protein [Hyphomonadaceae bacterium]